ncbi:ABC transporter permease [Fictibacillus barbaricus]|uniref:Acetoin utilization transport system permease protein n=1 Tax=Fictibacillus barbaricus TaxID=182136 RepID=A0ABU1U0H7_9BACL|nr:FtsX-like permease family protein [Fictibacillus barbaricus]MDR7072968.1 acetoin utilization transport system permease protein [Fictibacillus barbaricus]
MRFKDKHRFVRSNMKKNKTRVWMTILASTIGCAFLIMLASVGFAVHKSAIDNVMEFRMVNEITVNKENGEMNEKDVKKLEKIGKVKAVTRKKSAPVDRVTIGDYQIMTNVMSAHMPSEKKAGFELAKGRMPASKNEVVVGYQFAQELSKTPPKDFANGLSEEEAQKKLKELSYKGDILNKTLTYHLKGKDSETQSNTPEKTLEVKVVGIGKKPVKEWISDNSVFITDDLYNEVISLVGEDGSGTNPAKEVKTYDEVKVYTATAEDVKAVTDKIEKMDYQTYSIIKELKEMNVYFTLFKAGLILIGAIAVLIASIGIFNTMTMAVTERSQDIGIMKAIGATPKTIKRIFLLESGYIGLWGVGLGTLLAYIVSYSVNFAFPIIVEQFMHEKAPEGFMLSYIPWSLTVIAVTICMGVTLLSGWRPAAKATTVDVLKALRRDV